MEVAEIKRRARLDPGKSSYQSNNLWSYLVVRRLSYYPTWLFLRLGASANQVTAISAISGLIGCGLLASGIYGAMIVGALLINLYDLLDHVDGNIARYNKSTSNYGKFIDSLTGACMTVLIFISAGVGVFNHYDSSPNSLLHLFSSLGIDKTLFPFLGLGISLAYVLPRYLAGEFLRASPLAEQEKAVGTLKGKAFSHILYKIGYNIILGFHMPLLLLFTIFGVLSIFVLFYAFLFACAFVIQMIWLLRGWRIA